MQETIFSVAAGAGTPSRSTENKRVRKSGTIAGRDTREIQGEQKKITQQWTQVDTTVREVPLDIKASQLGKNVQEQAELINAPGFEMLASKVKSLKNKIKELEKNEIFLKQEVAEKNVKIEELSERVDQLTKSQKNFEETTCKSIELGRNTPIDENMPWVYNPEYPNLQDLQPKFNQISNDHKVYADLQNKTSVLREKIRIQFSKIKEFEQSILTTNFNNLVLEFTELKTQAEQFPIIKMISDLNDLIRIIKIRLTCFSAENRLTGKEGLENPKDLENQLSKAKAMASMMTANFDVAARMFEESASTLNKIDYQLQDSYFGFGWTSKFNSPYEGGITRSKNIPAPTFGY